MKYKIYYLRDMSGSFGLSGVFNKQFKKTEIDELIFKEWENLFNSAEEAFAYISSIEETIANMTFTVLPYIKVEKR